MKKESAHLTTCMIIFVVPENIVDTSAMVPYHTIILMQFLLFLTRQWNFHLNFYQMIFLKREIQLPIVVENFCFNCLKSPFSYLFSSFYDNHNLLFVFFKLFLSSLGLLRVLAYCNSNNEFYFLSLWHLVFLGSGTKFTVVMLMIHLISKSESSW